jgi:hypothetical protein
MRNNRSVGGKKENGSLFCEPNRQFLPDRSHFHKFTATSSPAGLRLPPILGSSGFGGLEDACWPLVPKFAGSNPAEDVGFFRAKKSPAHLPSEGK